MIVLRRLNREAGAKTVGAPPAEIRSTLSVTTNFGNRPCELLDPLAELSAIAKADVGYTYM